MNTWGRYEWRPHDLGNFVIRAELMTSGGRCFMEMARIAYVSGHVESTALVEVEWGGTARAALEEKLGRIEIEAAIDARLERFKRSSEGLFVPCASADLVIVEKPDAPSVRVLSRDDERGEEVEKRAVHVTDEPCSCPLPIVARIGCARLRGESRCVSRQDFLQGLRRSGLLPTKARA